MINYLKLLKLKILNKNQLLMKKNKIFKMIIKNICQIKMHRNNKNKKKQNSNNKRNRKKTKYRK